MRTRESRSQRGFTLIEAIVALVMMATALTGLYTWINTGLISLRRAEAATISVGVTQEALQHIALLPLMTQQKGRFSLGRYDVDWSARLAEPSGVNRTLVGAEGLYALSLFDVALSISLDTVELGSWSVRQLRHEQVRELGDD